MNRPQLFLVGLLSLFTGCNQQDVDGLGRIGKKALAQAGSAAGPLRDKFDAGRRGLAGVRERVQARLQWDKQLTETAIEVQVRGGEVELTGAVKSDDQRRRALDLAETTQGVERVNDQLQIAP
jgi:osmotically-inducible protein OsmY